MSLFGVALVNSKNSVMVDVTIEKIEGIQFVIGRDFLFQKLRSHSKSRHDFQSAGIHLIQSELYETIQ